jgi:hypothetical protein
VGTPPATVVGWLVLVMRMEWWFGGRCEGQRGRVPLLSLVPMEDVRRAMGTRFVVDAGRLDTSLMVEIVDAVSAVMLGLRMLAVEMLGCLTGRRGTEA